MARRTRRKKGEEGCAILSSAVAGSSTYSISNYIYTWRVLKNMTMFASRLVVLRRHRERKRGGAE